MVLGGSGGGSGGGGGGARGVSPARPAPASLTAAAAAAAHLGLRAGQLDEDLAAHEVSAVELAHGVLGVARVLVAGQGWWAWDMARS